MDNMIWRHMKSMFYINCSTVIVCHCMEVSCGIMKTSREWTLCISPGENVFDVYLTSRITHTVN